MTELPYGPWSSPISAADVARGGVGLYFPGLVSTSWGLETWWLEERQSQDGRHALVKRLGDGERRPEVHRDREHVLHHDEVGAADGSLDVVRVWRQRAGKRQPRHQHFRGSFAGGSGWPLR